MRSFLLLPLALLALPASAAERPAPPPAKPGSCVSVTTNDAITPFDENSVYVQTGIRRGYIARFMGDRCPSLRTTSTLIVERFGAQLCRGDRIRPINPPELIGGAYCVVDSFTPYVEPRRAKKRAG